MKKLLSILTLFVMSDQLLAGISIFKGTDTYGIGIGKSGISATNQGSSGGGSGPASDGILLETGDYMLLETDDYLLME